MRNYDYPAKNMIRDAWMRFLPAHFQDTNAHGLYLPGIQNLELSTYLHKRMVPARLIGIENDPDRIEDVRKNAKAIHLLHGNVRDAVRVIEEGRLPRLRFANLDFEGLYHRLISEILSLFRVFPSEKGGYLCVTSFSSRDEETLHQGMIHTSKFYSGRRQRGEFLMDYGRMVTRYAVLDRTRSRPHRTPDYSHLTRELGFLWWMTLVMGVMEYDVEGYGVLNEAYLAKIDMILERISERVGALSEGVLDFHLVNDLELADIMAHRTCFLSPSRFQHYIYSNGHQSPMHVWMLKIDFVKSGKKPTHQEVLERVWQFATHTPLVSVDKNGDAKTLV